jgi:hypothetical protein
VSTDVERDAMAASTKEAKSRCGAAADICLFLGKKWEGVLCRTLRPEALTYTIVFNGGQAEGGFRRSVQSRWYTTARIMDEAHEVVNNSSAINHQWQTVLLLCGETNSRRI